ncbi:MAG: hypothetical protein A2X45_25660 [Lentisphaerae bacterium GWF2_50_93]|nr:MAG: hypothetical protein A2X45_25660 [Lentisphaerae bacterium GWF2_50_93]
MNIGTEYSLRYSYKYKTISEVVQNPSTCNYGFNFDPIGNHVTSTTSESGTPVQTSYTANSLNQYSLINDGAAKTPAYDFDGNMTGDGSGWAYSWDAENRLLVAEKTGQRLEFKYDYGSRRVEKKVIDGGIVRKCERFVYNGFKQIERLNALDSNSIFQKFIWRSERMLSMTDSNGIYYYGQDANKNASELIYADGTLKAHYEYSPFGNTTVANGDLAGDNPFRFSSEFMDDETGLAYYNFRYYNPKLGRWLSRDPIGNKKAETIFMQWSSTTQ